MIFYSKLSKIPVGVTWVFLILTMLLLASCSQSKLQYQSKLDREIRKAQVVFGSKDFEKAYVLLDELIKQGEPSGDVAYYYAHCLNTLKNDSESAQKYYLAAIKWFDKYESQFLEDNNRDKAYYNIGQLYHRYETLAGYNKAKAIWDIGLKANPDNVYIKQYYNNLLLNIEYTEIKSLTEDFLQEYDECNSLADLEKLDKKYKDKIEGYDFKLFKKQNKEAPEFLVEAVGKYRQLIDEKKALLSKG
jgi:tetratricopeptide (TPR) repeat protein